MGRTTFYTVVQKVPHYTLQHTHPLSFVGLGGHSDLLGGVVVCKDAGHAALIHKHRSALGDVMGNMETWLLLRSLRTLNLRVKRQSKTAGKGRPTRPLLTVVIWCLLLLLLLLLLVLWWKWAGVGCSHYNKQLPLGWRSKGRKAAMSRRYGIQRSSQTSRTMHC